MSEGAAETFTRILTGFGDVSRLSPRSGLHCRVVMQGPPITTPSWCAFRRRDEEANGVERSLRAEEHSATAVTC